MAEPTPARFVLPRTAYLWLALLLVALLIGERPLTTRPARPKPTTVAREGLSETDFDRYLEAERQTRIGFALPTSGSSFATAEKTYTELAASTKLPNMTRRVLILRAIQKKPFDPALLTALPATERPLWQALYSGDKTLRPPADTEAQLKAMRLRFLEGRARADLYRALGDEPRALQAEDQLRAKASRSFWSIGLLGLIAVGLGLGGCIAWILFLIAARTRNWPLVGRVTTRPIVLGWGGWLDVFLFYLASYRLVGVLLALVLKWLPTATLSPLVLHSSLQLGTGLLAIAYAAMQTRRAPDARLTELGWSRERLGANLAYGVVAYAAALPLVVALSWLSNLIFRHTTTTPNPILPLLAGSSAPLDRFLIFCMATLLAPLFEEFFFRGALYTGFRARWRTPVAVALSALVFAMVHPIQDWLPIFGLGVVLGTVRELRQSIVPGIVAHFLQNSFAFWMILSLFSN